MGSANAQEHALDVASGELHGTITRTSSSVIGRRGGETVIFAIANHHWSVTAMLTGIRIAFVLAPQGVFRKTLRVEGWPTNAVAEILDDEHLRKLEELSPLRVQLMPNGVRLEQKLGAPDDSIGRAMDVVVALAERTRAVQRAMTYPGRLGHS
jgi:hypothetical protein